MLNSFLRVKPETHFPIQNIPFGVFSPKKGGNDARCGTIIGDNVIDLAWLESRGFFKGKNFGKLHNQNIKVFNSTTLNKFMEYDNNLWQEARETVQTIFKEDSSVAKDPEFLAGCVHNVKDINMHLPASIGDYTDFNSSKHHSYNMGMLLRGYKDIQRNWLRLPIGYCGRSSTVAVSGTDFRRPRGQTKYADRDDSEYVPTRRLDFEMELGAFLGGRMNKFGEPITTAQAWDSVFGFVMLNDWSARDIQTWEYVPLGPLNSKNFITTISPWIVTLEAMKEFRVKLPEQDPEPLLYLKDKNMWGYDITLEAHIKTQKTQDYELLCRSNYKYLHWTIAQQLAHHTVSGCNMKVGDLIGSGACSGPEPGEFGTFVELSANGKKPVKLSNGEERSFTNDGDSINLQGYSKSKNGY